MKILLSGGSKGNSHGHICCVSKEVALGATDGAHEGLGGGKRTEEHKTGELLTPHGSHLSPEAKVNSILSAS